jgi:hypothetical protein
MVAKKVTGDTKKKVAPKKKVVVKKVAPKKVISNVAQEIENPKTETVMEKKIKFNKVYVIFGVALLILIVVFYLL